MQSAPANPLGHFEPKEIVAIHDRILAAVGSSWSDWSAFPAEWYQSQDRDVFFSELRNAINIDYLDSDVFTVKDPRIVRFIPIWRKLLDDLKIRTVAVLPYRNPIEVALSLRHRDKLPIEHGLLLWLRHVLEAEYHSRDFPRHFISYETLLSHKQMSIYRLIEALPIAWPNRSAKAFDEITQFLDTKLRRQTASVNDLSLHREIPREVRDVYELYERLSADPQDIEVMRRLDTIRLEFERSSGLMAGTFRDLRVRFETDHQSFLTNDEQFRLNLEKFSQQELRFTIDHENINKIFEQNAQIELLSSNNKLQIQSIIEKISQIEDFSVKSENQRQTLSDQISKLALRSARNDADGQKLHEQISKLELQSAKERERLEALVDQNSRQAEQLAALQRHLEDSQKTIEDSRKTISESQQQILSLQETVQLQLQTNEILHGSLVSMMAEIKVARRLHDKPKPARFWRTIHNEAPRSEHDLVSDSGFFDSRWYRDKYEIDADVDALEHFIAIGSLQGYSPGPLFDSQWYLGENLDVAHQGINPLTHFLTFGRDEGRTPLRSLLPTKSLQNKGSI